MNVYISTRFAILIIDERLYLREIYLRHSSLANKPIVHQSAASVWVSSMSCPLHHSHNEFRRLKQTDILTCKFSQTLQVRLNLIVIMI